MKAVTLTVYAVLTSTVYPCKNDLECELNGECDTVGNVCICDKGWKGPTCGELILGEPTVAYGYGSKLSQNISAWGGGPPSFNGTHYHMFASQISNGCGMSCWSRQSESVHLYSTDIKGPYALLNKTIDTWAHNTFYTYSVRDNTHLIYTIGDGSSPASCNFPLNCSKYAFLLAHFSPEENNFLCVFLRLQSCRITNLRCLI